jgi:hypothetical protein
VRCVAKIRAGNWLDQAKVNRVLAVKRVFVRKVQVVPKAVLSDQVVLVDRKALDRVQRGDKYGVCTALLRLRVLTVVRNLRSPRSEPSRLRHRDAAS